MSQPTHHPPAVPTNPRARHIWIGAALRMAGSNFAKIARELGVSAQYVQKATTENSRRPQEAIAAKIGLPVHVLFPEWYDQSGNRFGDQTGCDHNSDDGRLRNVECGTGV